MDSCCGHGHNHEHGHSHSGDDWKLLAILSALCLVFTISGWLCQHFFPSFLPAIVCYVLAYACGAYDAARDAWPKILKLDLDIHFLMLFVAFGAALIGAWWEGAVLLFLFSASGAMEHYAMGRTRRAIDALLKTAPKTARTLDASGSEIELPVEELKIGMTVLLASGNAVPVDLRLTKGQTTVDESNLTGEAQPVPKKPGDTLSSGTINLSGAVEGVVLHPASESALQRIISLIEEAQEMKAPAQRFTDRFGSIYTWAILLLCFGMFFVWYLFFGLPPFRNSPDEDSALYRAMTLLVVCSPCALVLSVPASILSAIASGARKGILFRGGAAIENLAAVDVVAMDKTGTLTSGHLELVSSECLEGDEKMLKSVAFCFSKLSQHPLSRSLIRAGTLWEISDCKVGELETLMGRGLKGTFAGNQYYLGSRHWLQELDPTFNAELSGLAPLIGAEVWVRGPGLLGRFVFQDELRAESRDILQTLRKDGVKTVMLTGDRRANADAAAEKLGLDVVLSECLPEDKVAAIQNLKDGGKHQVAMIGDGVNDAPCLAAADVGVAMGGRGSDAALEQAEVVLMRDRLENFLLARQLSVFSRTIIHQNIFIALATVAVMAFAAFIYPVPLALGVFIHEG
ncbi:MAG: heavy metal translocating P-type ATPase, partial [Chthoniobacterales bacterium]